MLFIEGYQWIAHPSRQDPTSGHLQQSGFVVSLKHDL